MRRNFGRDWPVNYKFCEETGTTGFPQNSICKSIPQKVALMQELLQNGEEVPR
jgi:hypothetical protein